MKKQGDIWQHPGKAENFLEIVRGGIPLASEQIDVLRRVVRAAGVSVRSFLDLGCGDGILGRAILDDYPEASGLFLDYSSDMIQSAKEKVKTKDGGAHFISSPGAVPLVARAKRSSLPRSPRLPSRSRSPENS